MMEQNPARPARKVAIADSLWDAFEEMANQMGSDRDALINQAMFMFARLNGFMDSAGAPGSAGASGSNGAGSARAGGARSAQKGPVLSQVQGGRAEPGTPMPAAS